MKIQDLNTRKTIALAFFFIAFSSFFSQRLYGQYTQMGKWITQTENFVDQTRGDGYRGNRLAISKDGSTMAIGLEFLSESGSLDNRGAVRLYTRTGLDWVFYQEIYGPDINNNRFGHAVALSADGKTLVVGADYYSAPQNNFQGAAYIFTKGTTGYAQFGTTLSGLNNLSAQFGSSVGISDDGNTIIVGGMSDQVNATDPTPEASAWIFVKSGNAYLQLGTKLRGAEQTPNDSYSRFQVAISGDGNTAAMGGFTNNSTIGAVFVFAKAGSVWSQQGQALVGTGYTGTTPREGSSVALSYDGNTILFGGEQVNTQTFGGYIDDNSGPGAAWIFTRSGTTWSQNAKITPPSTGDYENFGTAVALAADGNTAYITGSDDSLYTGALWVYKKNQNLWNQVGKFKPYDKDSARFIGTSIAINGDGSLIMMGVHDYSFPDIAFKRVSQLSSTAATLKTAEAYPTDSVYFNGTIQNPDTYASSSTTYIRYYLSSDNVYDAADTPLSLQIDLSNIPAGGTLTFNQGMGPLPNVAPGTYHILEVRVTAYPNTYSQSNVLASLSLKVGSPDFVLSALKAPASVNEGGSYTVTCSLTNSGTINTKNQSQINFYLSSDSLYDVNDVALGTDTVGFKKAGSKSAYSAALTIPTVTTAGTYYILAVADPLKKVTELNESDNVANVKTTIVFTPDFQVSAVTVNPITVQLGNSITVNATITNQGKGSTAGKFFVRYFVSQSSTFSSTLTPYIDSTSIAVLAQQQSVPVSVTIPVATSSASGTYYVFVYADQGRTQNDLVISNNIGSAPYTVVGQPDISLASLSVAPNTISPGDNFAVNVSVKNTGGSSTGATIRLQYFLSTDTVSDGSDIVLNAIGLPALNAGVSEGAPQEMFKLPATTAAGTYYVVVVADSANSVAESNEKNNTANAKVTVQNLPDIEVKSVNPGAVTVMQGNALNVTATINNKGLVATTGKFFVRYFISQNPTFSSTLTPYTDSTSIGILAAQQSVPVNISIPVSASAAAGNYYVFVYADQGRTQNEVSVINNVASASYTVVTPPDISLANLAVTPNRLSAGSNFVVNVSIRNTGGSSSGLPVSLQYFLSTDTIYDLSDIVLTDTVHGPVVNAASSQNAAQKTFKLSTDVVAGNYFVIIVADRENAIAESNEKNNAISFQVVVSSLPDLVVTTPAVSPGSVLPGGSTSISSSVANQGGSSSGAVTTIQYFLSSDITLDDADMKLTDTIHVNAIAAGASLAVPSKSVQIPSSVVPGSYYVLFVVDQGHTINETNFTNNISYLALSVSNYPDLLPLNGQVTPQQGLASAQVSVSFQVMNSAATAAGASTAKVVFSKDSMLDNTDVLMVGSIPVKALASAEIFAVAQPKLALPSGTSPGVYFILVVADADNSVLESNETNNFQAIKYTVVSPSDISVSATSATPATVFAGDSIQIGSTVWNNGGTDVVSPFSLQYVLSADGQYDASDIILNIISFNALPHGGSVKEPLRNFQIPASTLPGNYSVIIIADPQNALSDQDRSNNVASIQVNIISLPDLRVVNFSANPSNVLTGNSATFNADILNSGGTATTTTCKVRILLSQDLNPDQSDYLLGEQTIDPVPAGAKQSLIPINYLVPDTMTSGNFNIIATIDPDNQVRESDEKNNLSAVGLNIGHPDMPDLIVSNLYVSSSITLGDQVSIESSVDNIGGAGSATSSLEYYLSSDDRFDISDLLLGSVIQTGPIGVGKTFQAVSAQYALPADIRAGSYYILALINRNGTVKESNQNNNLVSSLIKVLALPDLTLSPVALVPASIYPGENTLAKCYVRNAGAGPTNASVSVQLFLSADQAYDAQDMVISSLVPVPVIAAGDSFQIAAAKALIPASTPPGIYYVLLIADAGSSVKESNENNNVAFVTIELKPMPDLAIESPSASPSTVFQDDITSFSCTVRNIGAGAAPKSSSLVLYLSKDRQLDLTDQMLGGKLTIPALGAGVESTVFTYNYQVPSAMVSATYYVLLVADPDTSLHELTRTNNYGIIRFTVGNPDLTDLTLSYNFVSPSSLVAGDSASIECVVTNIGAVPVTQPYQLRYYLSKDQDYDNSDIPLGDIISMKALKVLDNDSVPAKKFQIPPTVTPGNYNILFFADDENVVSEANEENNIAVFSFRVLPYPDLIITKIVEDTNSIYIGDTLKIISSVRNSGGTATSKSTTIQYFISKDQVLDPSDIPMGNGFPVKSLLSTQLLKDSNSVMMPLSIPAGNYYILAAVDPNNIIPEANDSNNRITIAINVRPRPIITFPLNVPTTVNATNTGVSVGAYVQSDIPLASVTFSYRKITDSGTTVTQKLLITPNQYKGDIPASFIDEIGTEYTFMATDKEGNRSLPGKGSIHVRHPDPGLVIPYSSFGVNTGSYRIISVPLNLTNSSIDSVFGKVLGTYDRKKWRFFTYRTGANIEFKNSLESIEPGKGYWLIVKDKPLAALTSGTGITVNATIDKPFGVKLLQGWNQIGNPYNMHLSFSEIKNSRINRKGKILNFMKWTGKWNVDGDTLHKMEGAFVFAPDTMTLYFPTQKNSAIQTRQGIEEQIMNSENWFVNLAVEAGDMEYPIAGFGMRETASLSADEFDLFTPPSFGDFLEINFKHPEYFYPKFTRDVTASCSEHVWNFEVNSDLSGEKVLKWDSRYLLTSGKKFVLYDETKEKLVDMSKCNKYAFEGSSKNFRIVYGPEEFVESSLTPDKILLGLAPNPFSESAVVTFSLPDDAIEADLAVFNSLGEHVVTLINGSVKAGFHELSWDRKTANGSRVPEGVYLLRLQVDGAGGKQTYSRKMVVR